jgi:hypothetical protein
MTERSGKLAEGVLDIMKAQPLVLALLLSSSHCSVCLLAKLAVQHPVERCIGTTAQGIGGNQMSACLVS